MKLEGVAAAGLEGFREAWERTTGEKLDPDAALVMLIHAGAQALADRARGNRKLGELTIGEFRALTGATAHETAMEAATAAATAREHEEKRMMEEAKIATETVRSLRSLVMPQALATPDELDMMARWARQHWQPGACLVVAIAWAEPRIPGKPGFAHQPLRPTAFAGGVN